ncbi:MAG: hypothetical protein COB49_01015 [Alphaproteobacteria bacterium]|nr:MAG: hypothetical protein COB49_01015 [Alphaproteobacteria bacterium]
MHMMRNIIFTLAVVILLLPGLSPEKVLAANLSSRWTVDQHTRSRLFVGGYDKENRILHLGWQLSLKAGWKTYWRTPGDAGLPPRWTWKETENVRAIAVRWPVPELINIFDMDTYIYHDEVILPIDVEIADTGMPVSLALDLQYLICAEVCIPQEATYSLDISSVENIKISLFQKAQLDRYRDLVPVKLSGRDIVIRPDPDQENMLLLRLPENFINIENIILEGANGLLFGRVTAKGHGRFNIIHNGKLPLEGQELTLTLLSEDNGASEMKIIVRP